MVHSVWSRSFRNTHTPRVPSALILMDPFIVCSVPPRIGWSRPRRASAPVACISDDSNEVTQMMDTTTSRGTDSLACSFMRLCSRHYPSHVYMPSSCHSTVTRSHSCHSQAPFPRWSAQRSANHRTLHLRMRFQSAMGDRCRWRVYRTRAVRERVRQRARKGVLFAGRSNSYVLVT